MLGILGAGSWGTALAISLGRHSKVLLWHRDEDYVKILQQSRKNEKYLKDSLLPENVTVTHDFDYIVKNSRYLFIAIPSSHLEEIFVKLVKFDPLNIILCSKGFCASTQGFYSEFAEKMLSQSKIAILSGPNFAHEVAKKLPTASVLASKESIFRDLANNLSTPEFKITYSPDIIGVQLMGAVKNIYAIGAGILRRNFPSENFMAAYIAKAVEELKEILNIYNADINTIFTPAGIGDLFLTCSSQTSRNFRYGYNFVDNTLANETVEGLFALKVITHVIGNQVTKFTIIDTIAKIVLNKEDVSIIKDLL